MKTKICIKCGKRKPLSEFHKCSQVKDGHKAICKICRKSEKFQNLIRQKNYYKKYPWKRTLTNIRQRCNNQKMSRYKDYGGRGIKCLITEEEIKQLWFRDKAYKMEKPSIDRINNDGNYTFNNCQYIELFENHQKMIKEKNLRKPILQYDLNGKFIQEWESIKQAERILNLSVGCITRCCHKIQKTAYNYIWRFK